MSGFSSHLGAIYIIYLYAYLLTYTTVWYLPGGPDGMPARWAHWAATSNVEGGSGRWAGGP